MFKIVLKQINLLKIVIKLKNPAENTTQDDDFQQVY